MKLNPYVESITVREIIEGNIRKIGKISETIFLPTIQRDFIWNEKKMIELLDSIYKGFPIGTLTILKTNYEFPCIPIEGSYKPSAGEKYYLIDGQQRLMTLLLLKNNWALKREKGKTSANIHRRPLKCNPVEAGVNFNLKNGENIAEIIKMTINYKDSKFRELGQRILDYEIPFCILSIANEGNEKDVETMYEQVAEMFVRINKSGMKIGNIEMFLSFFLGAFGKVDIRAKIRDEIYKDINDKYSVDFEPVLRFIFWALLCNMRQTDFSRKGFAKVLESLKGEYSNNPDKMNEVLNKCQFSIEESLKFLSTELGINKSVVSRFLPSQNTFVPIFSYFYKVNDKVEREDKKYIITWFIYANFFNAYSQSTNSKIQHDLEVINKIKNTEFPIKALIKNMKISGKQIGATKILEKVTKELDNYESIENYSPGEEKGKKNYQFLIYSLLHLNGASDFTGKPIKECEEITIHHIFPSEYLEKNKEKYLEVEGEELNDDIINDFANITFVNKSVNSQISDNEPQEYLRKYEKTELEKHFIPNNKGILKIEEYNAFLFERASMIAKATRKYLKIE